jgi:hypothetical protein
MLCSVVSYEMSKMVIKWLSKGNDSTTNNKTYKQYVQYIQVMLIHYLCLLNNESAYVHLFSLINFKVVLACFFDTVMRDT